MIELRALPKANLHLHLTGSMRPRTLAELAARYGVEVPDPLPADAAHDWGTFQGRYDAARSAIRTAADLRRVVAEAVEDNLADGCGWLELQVDPTSYAPMLGGLEPVVEAALEAMAGAPAALIVASSWAAGGDHALRLARLAVRHPGVVGFGISNDERRGSPDDFVPAARVAAEAGLLVVPHAGFYEGPWHVRDCVEKLGAHRIGHGLTAMHDPPTVELLAARGVTLEVCPTSYPPLGVAALTSLPLKNLLTAGVPVAIASDDPLLFGADVTAQYEIARDVLGLSPADLAALAHHSISASAAPADTKRHLTSQITQWFAAATARPVM